MRIICTLALPIVVSAIVLLAATGHVLSLSPAVIAAQILALGLAVWARRSFPAGSFRVTAAPSGDAVIQRGPYRLIRHPMYSAALLLVWASILGRPEVWTSVVGVVVTTVVAIRIVTEERLLRARYPAYTAYAESTKALVPFVL